MMNPAPPPARARVHPVNFQPVTLYRSHPHGPQNRPRRAARPPPLCGPVWIQPRRKRHPAAMLSAF